MTPEIDIRNLPINKVINGNFDFNQRGNFTGLSGFINQYVVDRFSLLSSAGNPQVINTLVSNNSMRVTATTGGAMSASGYVSINHKIEGYFIEDLSGKSIAIKFKVQSSKTGICSAFLTNEAFDQRIAIAFNIDSANTLEEKILFIPAISFAGWNLTSGTGLQLSIILAADASRQEDFSLAWIGGVGSTASEIGQENFLADNGDYFEISKVMLYEATHGDIEFRKAGRDYQEEESLCYRYLRPWKGGSSAMYCSFFGQAFNGNILLLSGRSDFLNMRTNPSFSKRDGTFPVSARIQKFDVVGFTGGQTITAVTAPYSLNNDVMQITFSGSPFITDALYMVNIEGFIYADAEL